MSPVEYIVGTRIGPGTEETSARPETNLDEPRGGRAGGPRETSKGPDSHPDGAGSPRGLDHDLHKTSEGPRRALGGTCQRQGHVQPWQRPRQDHFQSRTGMRTHPCAPQLPDHRAFHWSRWLSGTVLAGVATVELELPQWGSSSVAEGPLSKQVARAAAPGGPRTTGAERKLSYGVKTFLSRTARGSIAGRRVPGMEEAGRGRRRRSPGVRGRAAVGVPEYRESGSGTGQVEGEGIAV